MCQSGATPKILAIKFRVEREMDQHWYRVEDAIEATSAGKAVESCANAEGTYSARPAATPNVAPELFAVPSSGQPVRLSRR